MLDPHRRQAAASAKCRWGNIYLIARYAKPAELNIHFPSLSVAVVPFILLPIDLTKASKYQILAHRIATGVFVANADSSLVLATSGTISSGFDDLGDAGWLISSYTLAMCAAQSLVSFHHR